MGQFSRWTLRRGLKHGEFIAEHDGGQAGLGRNPQCRSEGTLWQGEGHRPQQGASLPARQAWTGAQSTQTEIWSKVLHERCPRRAEVARPCCLAMHSHCPAVSLGPLARQLTAIGRCTPTHWVDRCLPQRREMKEGPKIVQGKERRKRREKKVRRLEEHISTAFRPPSQLQFIHSRVRTLFAHSAPRCPLGRRTRSFLRGMTVTRSNECTVLCISPKLLPPSSDLMTYGAVLGAILTGEALLK